MILSAVKFTLKVLKGGILSLNHGRLLHAAFLNLVRGQDEGLSAWLHDSNQKCFALDLLRGKEGNKYDWRYWDDRGKVYYHPGQELTWMVNGLTDQVTKLLLSIPMHSIFQVGTLTFEIVGREYKSDRDDDCGLITMEGLTFNVSVLPCFNSVTLNFLTPTTFRCFDCDCPFPRPELVFGSILDKWNEFSDAATFDAKEIRSIATEFLIPDRWEGRTLSLKLTDTRAVKAFMGSFTYNFTSLVEEMVSVFILLAEYASFSGVGRLTGQGLGRVKISYK